MTDIIAFQAGREARISNKPRDGRRNADWLRGWDQVDADERRRTGEAVRWLMGHPTNKERNHG